MNTLFFYDIYREFMASPQGGLDGDLTAQLKQNPLLTAQFVRTKDLMLAHLTRATVDQIARDLIPIAKNIAERIDPIAVIGDPTTFFPSNPYWIELQDTQIMQENGQASVIGFLWSTEPKPNVTLIMLDPEKAFGTHLLEYTGQKWVLYQGACTRSCLRPPGDPGERIGEGLPFGDCSCDGWRKDMLAWVAALILVSHAEGVEQETVVKPVRPKHKRNVAPLPASGPVYRTVHLAKKVVYQDETSDEQDDDAVPLAERPHLERVAYTLQVYPRILDPQKNPRWKAWKVVLVGSKTGSFKKHYYRRRDLHTTYTT